MTQIALASPADVPAVVEIESNPSYEGQLGRWPLERHLQEMALPSSRYLVLRGRDGKADGFALLQGFGDPDRKIHLKRIAVREAGEGIGSLLLAQMLMWVFTQTDTHRVDLEVFDGNARARRAYEKAGFRAEGLLRDYHRRTDGMFSSMWLMSILRPEWDEGRR